MGTAHYFFCEKIVHHLSNIRCAWAPIEVEGQVHHLFKKWETVYVPQRMFPVSGQILSVGTLCVNV
jgi:hypothetical protein